MPGPEGSLSPRPTVAADLPVLYEFQADPVAAQMAGFPSRDRPAYFAHWAGVLADDTVVKSTILVDGGIAGSLVLFGAPDAREVGYWVGRPYWGRHVASRALALFLAEVPERPLRGYVVPGNVGSRRVLVTCGFVESGQDGEHLVYVLD